MHDGDDALVRRTAQLGGYVRIVIIKRRQNRARGVGGQRFALIAQRHVYAEEFVAAVIGLRLALHALVDGRQGVVGRQVHGLLPIVERGAELIGSISGHASQHQHIGIARMPAHGHLHLLQRLRGLIGFEQLLSTVEGRIAGERHGLLRLGDHWIESAQHVHRGCGGTLVIISLHTGERRRRNIAQNILAADCRGDFEAIRAVRETEADFYRCARRQAGNNVVFRIAARAQRSLVRADGHCRDEKKHRERHVTSMLRCSSLPSPSGENLSW